jgi:cyclopropane fatty-acyl-phospholipid synthase-like methyltransferase
VYDRLKTATREYYEASLARFGDDPRGVNWRDAETQRLRFAVLCGVGDLTGRRLHDVGCGLAHLADYLRDERVACEYVGSDISPAMIEQARRRLSTTRLEVADLLAQTPAPWMRADYVVTSGLFHVRGSRSPEEWRGFVQAMVQRMFEMAGRGIAFNMMTSYVDYEDAHLYYSPPAEMLDFCMRHLGRRVVVRHDYPLWEYTVYAYKS